MRAAVHLVVVRRAPEVLVEREQRAERTMAQVALVCGPVPSVSRGPLVDDGRRVGIGAPGDHPRGIGDDVLAVQAFDDAVDRVAVDARHAPARLEVVDERSAGDECFVAASHRAGDRAASVQGGPVMMVEVVPVLKHPLAGDAVPVGMLLAAVLMEPQLEREELWT